MVAEPKKEYAFDILLRHCPPAVQSEWNHLAKAHFCRCMARLDEFNQLIEVSLVAPSLLLDLVNTIRKFIIVIIRR